jgi:hypothetical protein
MSSVQPKRSKAAAERDRRLIEAGEPPWGNVLPGTDEVVYYELDRPTGRHRLPWGRATESVLIRAVAREGAFYAERYAGEGRWVGDSDAIGYLMNEPGNQAEAIEISGRHATGLMEKIDRLVRPAD